MKIRQVRFKNLNSLVGEWQIDLTHPAYVSNGIFAITGPTGSGKSTILDAICLALYGRTPRLGRISKSSNEIMSRQTGECFAEVCFETKKGRFRCHWSQHRARRRPEGDLQAPKHEIADALTDKVYEAKLRGVAEQIEEMTGMDFDRFTRSMLLAQGGFAAFLQAGADERAPILEQITGTGIYSQISISVHERYAEERKKQDLLQAELDGYDLLTPEAEKQLDESLQRKLRQEACLNQQLKSFNLKINWIETVRNLEADLVVLEEKEKTLEQRLADFKPNQLKLEKANKALELSAVHAHLMSVRRAQEQELQQLQLLQSKLPEQEKLSQEAADAVQLAEKKLDLVKTQLKQLMPHLKKVRGLDLEMKNIDSQMRMNKDSLQEYVDTGLQLKNKLAQGKADLDKVMAEMTAINNLLEESKTDEQLIEQLAGLQNRAESLQQNWRKLADLSNAVKETKKQVNAYEADLKQKQARSGHQAESLAAAKKQLDQKQDELQTILCGSSITDYRSALSALTDKKQLLEKTAEAAAIRQRSSLTMQTAMGKQQRFNKTLQNIVSELDKTENKLTVCEKEIGYLEKQLVLVKRVEDLEDIRPHLNDGEPCPLCGALDHPYTDGQIPQMDETQKLLQEKRLEQSTIRKELSGLQINQAESSKDLEKLASDIDEHTKTIQTQTRQLQAFSQRLDQSFVFKASEPVLDRRLADWLKELQENKLAEKEDRGVEKLIQWLTQKISARAVIEELDWPSYNSQLRDNLVKQLSNARSQGQLPVDDGQLEDNLAVYQAWTDCEINFLSRLIQQAEKLDEALRQLRDQVDNLKEQASKAHSDAQEAIHQKNTATQALRQRQKEQEELNEQTERLAGQLLTGLQPFGISQIDLKKLDQVMRSLSDRRRLWQERQKQSVVLQQLASSLGLRLEHLETQANQNGGEQQKIERKFEELKKTFSQLKAEREAIFGIKDPDSEEDRLSEAIEQAESELKEYRTNVEREKELYNQLKTRAGALNQSIESRKNLLSQSEQDFLNRLGRSDFEDEAQYLIACLPDDERKTLTKASQKLNEEQTQLNASRRDKQVLLENERQKALTKQSLDDLVNASKQREDARNNIQQDIGAIKQKLTDQELAREKQALRLQALQSQKKEVERWAMLHDLIGSADGKKFRVFAQGLTFDMLVGHANQQLQKMTDRYLLTRDKEIPLELNVVDNYQAGEIRSTKNLSGGECFIMSLALALGLSNMASINVQVDSLFLDEGFGTLDEDALDVALETLSSLQKDGKLIGVISHVSALKERIGTQIQVIPRTGGRSRIDGPGCSGG